jgi:tetratricopeptide (TPR) repeat protein
VSNQVIYWAGAIGGLAAIPIVCTASVAASAPEIAKIAKSVSVQVSEAKRQGSGVILQREGDVYTVLTAAHVVKNKTAAFTIATSDGKTHPIVANSVRTADRSLDLAVFKFRAAGSYPTAKLGSSNLLSEGMEIYVGGYPLPTATITKSVFVFRTGSISANSTQPLDKGYSLIYSNDTLPGMSGGAVLNKNGELVAIHGRGDREQNSSGELGQKTGFNLGIPIERFASIAANLGVNLNQKIAVTPPNRSRPAEDFFVLASQKYDRGDYRGALADYDRAIAIKPSYAKAYRARATVKTKLDRQRSALSDLDRAIELDAKDELSYGVRGFLKYDSLNDIPGAIADLSQAIKLNPNNSKNYAMRGGIRFQKLNDGRGASSDLNRAIELEPDYANNYLMRGILKFQMFQDARGALADFDRLVKLDPQNANAYMLRGLVYKSTGNRAASVKNLRQSAKLAQQQGKTKIYQQAMTWLRELGEVDRSQF